MLESVPLSSASTDNGLHEFFHNSPYEIFYHDVRLQGLGYQDDILRASKTVEDTKAGVMKLEAMAETKLLTYNEKKSCLVILGSPDKKRRNSK